MTASARTGLKRLALLLALAALVTIGLGRLVQSGRFKEWLQGEISRRSGYHLRADALSFSWPFTVIAQAVEISKPGQVQLKIRRLSASVNPFQLWSTTIQGLELDHPVLELDIDEILKAPAQGSSEIALRNLTVQDGLIVIKKDRATFFELPKINLTAQDLNLGGPTAVSLRADLPRLNGVAELRIDGQLRDLESELTVRPQASKNLLGPGSANAVSQEILRLRVKVRAPQGQKADATIESKFHRLALGDRKLTGALDAHVTVDAGFAGGDFSGQAALTDLADGSAPSAFKLPNGAVRANLRGSFTVASKTLTVKSLRLSSPLGNGDGAGQITFAAEPRITRAELTLDELPWESFKAYLPAPFNRWSYHGQGRLTVNLQGPWHRLDIKGKLQTDALRLGGDGVGVAKLVLSAPFEWREGALRFKESTIRADKLSYTPEGRWQAAAETLQIDGGLDYQAGGTIRVNGRMAAVGAKFSSPDSTSIGENLRVAGPLQLAADAKMTTLSVAGKLTAEGGELLWGKFFGDLKGPRPALELDGDFTPSEQRIECRRCALSLAKIGVIEIAGAIQGLSASPMLRLQARGANVSPAEVFEFFLRETFNRRYPILDELALAGDLAFGLRLDGPLDALSAAGEIALKGGELRAKSNGWQIGPVALNLPLEISWAPTAPVSSTAPRLGTLRIDGARFANQTIAPMRTTVSLVNNALRFHQPIRIGLFGGEIEIRNLSWPALLQEPKRVKFSIESKRLMLEELTQAMNWPRFSGTLTGSIPEVQSTESLLRTRGEIHAELFGGTLRMSKLEIENPFSALAAIKLDARLDGIHLEQLSKTFAFGRISGILEGSIDDFVLTDGQPSELRADIHSVDRGGEQRISVEALNKITVLSSGDDAGALYTGLASFFDSFRYSKLGFKATLKNDRLTLRGVESQGDKELLVVGSFLPPTVNVISHTQNIAFSELVRRLDRINKSAKPNVK